jgi:hypothetical protein
MLTAKEKRRRELVVKALRLYSRTMELWQELEANGDLLLKAEQVDSAALACEIEDGGAIARRNAK